MGTSSLPERDVLRLTYQEIIEGCSPISGYYVRHLSELEQIEIARKRLEFINAYVGQGIPSEKQRLAELRESEEWTEKDEQDIVAYRLTIADNEKMLSTVIPQQQVFIKNMIDENRHELRKLLAKRRFLIGLTADNESEKDATAYLAFLSLFKNRKCTEPMFVDWDEFQSIEEAQLEKYVEAIDEILGRFTDEIIRKISCLPFFLNAFSYCKEDLSTFLNKPIVQFTNFQVHLFSLGIRNLNILSQAEGSPPEYFDNVSADEIIRWYDIQYSTILGRRKQALQARHA